MCTNVVLYYIYLLISAMMDLLSDEIPPKFYERLRRRIWARLVIGLRTVWVAGCGMARKRSGRWTLWPCIIEVQKLTWTCSVHARSHQNFVVSLTITFKNSLWFTVPHGFFFLCPVHSRSHKILLVPPVCPNRPVWSRPVTVTLSRTVTLLK